MPAIKFKAELGDMHLMGKETLDRLNLPENIVLPTCLTISLNALLYLETSAVSVKGNPPSFEASGAL
jgi:hypothetical protein